MQDKAKHKVRDRIMTEHDHAARLHDDGTACHCEAEADVSTTAIDPVCGMTVAKEGAKHVASHAGRDYYLVPPGAGPSLSPPRNRT